MNSAVLLHERPNKNPLVLEADKVHVLHVADMMNRIGCSSFFLFLLCFGLRNAQLGLLQGSQWYVFTGPVILRLLVEVVREEIQRFDRALIAGSRGALE